MNWVEVLQRYAADGLSIAGKRQKVETLGLAIVDFSAEDAAIVARLRPATRAPGLSLADRACLALALRFGLPACTDDRAWAKLDTEIEVVILR